ncbi:hypothetical protein B5G52_16530 [Pseudoalteromonas sp. A601]|uniref:DUF262 domain-containing protein n=1 Tax=Pseudoalteromonas sp. A601 TaxID=1967839 RepID=UPI000B3CE85D|nr:DUF262 domain-containing protein [Pseudoalteromonas sp. A601]OUS69503.1 hypothetical protein B5G52_16530 [Pseudoalteromonas sp. A601]
MENTNIDAPRLTDDDFEEEFEEEILEPFDPEKISIEQKVVSMDAIKRRLKQGSIRLSPDFQRNEVWDETRKSQLIESIMLKIPLPMFYVSANEQGEWEVVDGLQRLSTIRDFLLLSPQTGLPLKLQKLEFLQKKFGAMTFAQMEEDPKCQRVLNTIMETELRFTVINPGTPEDVKRNIFKRINTGGLPLTSQEIRHALYQGTSTELLKQLMGSQYFIDAINSKINDKRMATRELILRFVAFYIFDKVDYKASLDKWLSDAMRVINLFPELEERKLIKLFPESQIPVIKTNSTDEIRYNFELAMYRAKRLFGEHAFRKSTIHDDKKTPVNKALFECWSNILCKLSEEDFNKLLKNKIEFNRDYKQKLLNDDLINSISRHASQAVRGVNFRYNTFNSLVNKYLEVL